MVKWHIFSYTVSSIFNFSVNISGWVVLGVQCHDKGFSIWLMMWQDVLQIHFSQFLMMSLILHFKLPSLSLQRIMFGLHLQLAKSVLIKNSIWHPTVYTSQIDASLATCQVLSFVQQRVVRLYISHILIMYASWLILYFQLAKSVLCSQG